MQVLPLKGFKSLRALNAFHSLLLGLKMLPAYMLIPYEKFYAEFAAKTEGEKETLVREAALFVQLEEDEVGALLSFTADANGIPYSAINLRDLKPDAIHEMIVAVCMEIGRIKITLVSEDEKKK